MNYTYKIQYFTKNHHGQSYPPDGVLQVPMRFRCTSFYFILFFFKKKKVNNCATWLRINKLPCSSVEEFSKPFLVITNEIPIRKLEQMARINPIYFDSSAMIKRTKKRKGTESIKNVHILFICITSQLTGQARPART
jgi:hypothetical protein